VRFRIGMLARFTEVPMAELVDRRLAVDALWGAAGSRLLSRLGDVGELPAQLRLIEEFLRLQLRERAADSLVERAMPMLYRPGAALTIERLADLSGLGCRQLERRWLRASGVTAAETRGLCRFQHSVRALLLDPAADVTDTALKHGYYDQAHFCRDFQSRLGQSPLAFLRSARARTHFYNTSAGTPGMLTTP
jgi:transcriptional regulator GlxA family with amidase domain